MDEKVKIVVLAGGKGKRMNGGDTPKVLIPVKGRPMISYVLEAIEKSGLDARPIIVVGHQRDKVVAELGNKYDYAIQAELLGTGHALSMAKDAAGSAENVMVLYGDHPLISDKMIKNLYEKHLELGSTITMATVKLPDFEDWRTNFLGFSRVIRDGNGKIARTIEMKDATEEEKKITEVNPCYFCFDAKFLWAELEKLKNDNAQKEYYLTDVLKSAVEQGIEIQSVEIDAKEALGANSKEELAILEKFI